MLLSKNIVKTIVRDIYHIKTRSFTIFISISIIIIFPVGFINSGPSLVTSLDHESIDSKLSHLEIFFLSISDATISQIENLTKPEAIEGRIRVTGIIDNKLINDQKQEVFIISYPENKHPTVNIPRLTKGDLSLSQGTGAILESFANYMNISLGDELQIKGSNSKITLLVTSFVTSVEFMSYNLLGNGVIYVNYNDALQLAELSANNSENYYNDVIMYFGPGSEVKVDFLKEKVKLIEEAFEEDINPYNDPQFIWFTRQSSVRGSLAEGTELVGEYLGAAASFAVLVTGFIIYIIMNRYINEEKKLIGVFQSFGFSKFEIIFIYAGKVFLIGLGSIIFGTVAAFGILYVITSTLANLWGISELFLVFSPEILTFFGFLAIICAILFAILPSYNVANQTPHESLREIRKIKVSNKGKINRFATLLPSIPKMAIRTLSRNRIRTFLTAFAVISAMALSIALLSALSSVNFTVDNYFQENLIFDGRIEYYQPQNASELHYYQNKTDVLVAEPSYYYLTTPLKDIAEVVSIRGIPEDSKNIIPDVLEKDENFSFLDSNNNFTNHALVSERVLRRLDLHIGNDLIVKWKIGGLSYSNLTFKIMGMVRDFEYSIGVYVSLSFVKQHLQNPENYISSITLQLKDKSSKDFINAELDRSKISFVSHIESIRGRVDRIINSQIFIVSITVLLGFMVAFISVFNTQYITLIERDRDISIMLAFGYNRKFFLFEFLLEIIILVPISVLIAIVFSRPIAQFFLNLIEDSVVRMDYYLGQSEIYLSLIFVLFTAFPAAVIPAFYFVNTKRLSNILRADE
jgi:ABC-type antimicrobial peptide transport system permease subunit